MLTYTEVKHAIKDSDRDTIEEVLKDYGEDVLQAALNCDINPSDIAETYSGHFSSDEEFTQDLIESCGDIPKDLPHYIHIDWEATARDIMMDYSEDSGYYFRNL